MEFEVCVLAPHFPTRLQMTLDDDWQASPLSRVRRAIVLKHDLLGGARFFAADGRDPDPLPDDTPCGKYPQVTLKVLEASAPLGTDPVAVAEVTEMHRVKQELLELMSEQLSAGTAIEKLLGAVREKMLSCPFISRGMLNSSGTPQDTVK